MQLMHFILESWNLNYDELGKKTLYSRQTKIGRPIWKWLRATEGKTYTHTHQKHVLLGVRREV